MQSTEQTLLVVDEVQDGFLDHGDLGTAFHRFGHAAAAIDDQHGGFGAAWTGASGRVGLGQGAG